MTLFSAQLILPSPARRRKAPISDLDFPELRQQLRRHAQSLQQSQHYEVTVRPHIDKLAREVERLKATCSDHEAKITEMEDDIRTAAEPQERPEDDRQEKVAKIAELEDRYQRLLAEKEAFLARADEGDFD